MQNVTSSNLHQACHLTEEGLLYGMSINIRGFTIDI